MDAADDESIYLRETVMGLLSMRVVGNGSSTGPLEETGPLSTPSREGASLGSAHLYDDVLCHPSA